MDEFAVYSAIQRINYWLRNEPELFFHVKDPVAILLRDMKVIQNLLAETASTRREEATEIRQIASDAEDVLDMFVYNIRSVDNHVGLGKIGGSIFNIQRAHSFESNLKALHKRIQDLLAKLEIHREVVGNDVVLQSSGSIVPEPDADLRASVDEGDGFVVGLEGDVQTMVQLLTVNEVDNQPYLFIIVGCPGAGKTTLARNLYNNTTLRQHFHRILWFDRPQDCLRDLQGDIFQRVTKRYPADMKAETWVDDIGKCLIFLDDITYNMMETLADLLGAFPSGLHGSMIVVTSSNNELLQFKHDSRCHFYEMREHLNEKEGWDLLCHLTCPKEMRMNSADTTLIEILGKEMLQKVEGKPEAITLLGGILRFKNHSIEDWEMVKKALTSYINGHGLKGVYELSYVDLPYYMKACFLYMANFPAKHQIQAGVFKRMWIAEGFEPNCSEVAVMQCLEELHCRRLIQVVSRNHIGSIKVFQLQGGVNEFCILKAREENFINIQPYDFRKSTNSHRIAVHSRWCIRRQNSLIRSLFQFQGKKDARLTIDILYKDLKLIRVLTLCGVVVSDYRLPDEIGNLIHLRYLALRNTNIEVLPESIGNLNKLLTLDWRDVYVHHKLLGPDISIPDVIWKMKQLKHLHIPKHMIYKERFKLQTLNNIQTLWGIRAGPWLVDEVKMWNFSKIQKLYLHNINTSGELEAIVWNINKFPNLYHLRLQWCPTIIGEVMERIYEYCGRLNQLKLTGPIGENEAGIRFPHNLRVLVLKISLIEEQDLMVVIGECCPSLKVLKLNSEAYTKTEMRSKAGSFPQLEELEVGHMEYLENWIIEKGALSHLKRLIIESCKKLERMPEGIRFIGTLRELKLLWMPRKFCDKLVKMEKEDEYLTLVADKIKGEDFYIIQHISSINFVKIR